MSRFFLSFSLSFSLSLSLSLSLTHTAVKLPLYPS